MGGTKQMGKNKRDMAYTRQEYIRSVPQSKITKLTIGDPKLNFEFAVSLIASQNSIISSNALEAVRITINRALTKTIGQGSFVIKVVTYPHLILREHKFMGFAGADRISQGMGKAFGKPTGRAARVKNEQKIVTVSVNQTGIDATKRALKRASKKLPTKYKINIEKL